MLTNLVFHDFQVVYKIHVSFLLEQVYRNCLELLFEFGISFIIIIFS